MKHLNDEGFEIIVKTFKDYRKHLNLCPACFIEVMDRVAENLIAEFHDNIEIIKLVVPLEQDCPSEPSKHSCN